MRTPPRDLHGVKSDLSESVFVGSGSARILRFVEQTVLLRQAWQTDPGFVRGG
jgi:hypothetical protein